MELPVILRRSISNDVISAAHRCLENARRFRSIQREVFLRLLQLGKRLRIIIDDSDAHGKETSAESLAAGRLEAAGASVKRHHMSNLQHNKTIVVSGAAGQAVVCGSTNYTWRGFFVQNNNALIIRGATAVEIFQRAFEDYLSTNSVVGFGKLVSAMGWQDLEIPGVDAQVTFSPHSESNAVLDTISEDVGAAQSSLLYSLAFLAQTKGSIRETITRVTEDPAVFTYGMADRRIGGIKLETPDGNVYPVYPAALSEHLPEPFKSEPDGLSGKHGTRMHHKFIVVDFDKPTARVYLWSYNFSLPADRENGENLVVIRDRKIAVSYMVEVLRMFDHYHFRVVQTRKGARTRLHLAKPPQDVGEKTWFDDYFTVPQKIRDREIFA